MKARDIRVGDMYIDPQSGVPIWTVTEIVDVVPSHVKVRVQHREGGGQLSWYPDEELRNVSTTKNSTGPTAAAWVRL